MKNEIEQLQAKVHNLEVFTLGLSGALFELATQVGRADLAEGYIAVMGEDIINKSCIELPDDDPLVQVHPT